VGNDKDSVSTLRKRQYSPEHMNGDVITLFITGQGALRSIVIPADATLKDVQKAACKEPCEIKQLRDHTWHTILYEYQWRHSVARHQKESASKWYIRVNTLKPKCKLAMSIAVPETIPNTCDRANKASADETHINTRYVRRRPEKKQSFNLLFDNQLRGVDSAEI
jgi:hypothetical protein